MLTTVLLLILFFFQSYFFPFHAQIQMALRKKQDLTKPLASCFLQHQLSIATAAAMTTLAPFPLRPASNSNTTIFQSQSLPQALLAPAPGSVCSTHTPVLFSPFWPCQQLNQRWCWGLKKDLRLEQMWPKTSPAVFYIAEETVVWCQRSSLKTVICGGKRMAWWVGKSTKHREMEWLGHISPDAALTLQKLPKCVDAFKFVFRSVMWSKTVVSSTSLWISPTSGGHFSRSCCSWNVYIPWLIN